MNKNNKLLLGILSFVVVCVVGYALFSETITVTGTATAEGSFDLTTSCEKGFSNDMIKFLKKYYSYDATVDSVQGGYSDDSCVVNENDVTIQTSLAYPGARRWFSVEVKNTGMIDAVIPISVSGATKFSQTVTVYNNSDDSILTTYKSTDTNFEDNIKNYGYFSKLGELSFIIAKNESGEIFGYSEDMTPESGMTMKDSKFSYLRIKPGESIIFAYCALWGDAATDSSKYSKVIMNASYPFTQITTDMIESSDVKVRY